MSFLRADADETFPLPKKSRQGRALYREWKWKQRRLQLLEKKLERGAYQTFLQLYRDLKHRDFGNKRLVLSLPDNNRVFYILLAIGMLLFLTAAVSIILFLLTGDVPLFRLFSGSLEQIGTIRMEDMANLW